MARLNVKDIIEREAKAQARKDEWRSIYEDCYEFALPQRNLYSGYYEGGVAGKGKMSRVFDSTAIHAPAFCQSHPGWIVPTAKRMVSP